MDDIETKRVYADRVGGAELLVAGGGGLVAVEVSGPRVGRFGSVHREPVAAIAGADGVVAVATEGDVRLRRVGGSFEGTGFGAAATVGVAAGTIYAADPDGEVARLDADAADPAWEALGDLDAAVRAIDPPLLAAADGLHRLPGLDFVGLDDAHDVAAAGPLAATGAGLYSLGNGWMGELDGAFRVAGSDGDRAHAATEAALYERRDGDWAAVDLPATGPVVDVAYGEAVYAVTEGGTVLAEAEDGWRRTPLGVDGVVGCVLG